MQAILSAARQAWPPFVLVAGLLLIGSVAAADGLFEAAGARLARPQLGARGLLLALLGLVAVVTAVLNLDTAVVFLTPVLVHAARRRALDVRPFLYGSVFMANAASLLLPGSNLTNLLVRERDPQSGAAFATQMLPAWFVSCAITALFLALAFRLDDKPHGEIELPRLQFEIGAAAVLLAAALVLLLRNAALPVLAVGLIATLLRRLRPRLDVRALTLLFSLTVTLGALARLYTGAAQVLDAHGPWQTAALGAVASVLVNNLPAAVLFSAQPPLHPHALLLGLDIGPNLAVTGSLSALLWLQAARSVDARASTATYSRLGLLLVPCTLAGTLAISDTDSLPNVAWWPWPLVAVGVVATTWAVFVAFLFRAGRREDARGLVGFIPDCAILVSRLLRDGRVPRRRKLMLVALLGYLSFPFDLVPDFIPVVGQLDDVIITAVVLRSFLRGSDRRVLREHWPGPNRSLDLLLRLAS
jgi:arsenical pump membrane protein